jgi:hypothetical protein
VSLFCSRSPRLLAQCLTAIQRRTVYSRRELVVVHHVIGEGDAAMEKVIAQQYNSKCIHYAGPFHISQMNNLAMKATDDEILFS